MRWEFGSMRIRFERKMATAAKAVQRMISIEFFKTVSLRSKSDEWPGIERREKSPL